MGESIGTFGTVTFTLSGEPGTWVWATIVEGGDTPEPFTATVSGGPVEYAVTNVVNFFMRVNFLLALGDDGQSQVIVADSGCTDGITQENSFGSDISVSFQKVALDISMPHTTELTEESPGEYVGNRLFHPDAPLSPLTVAPCFLFGFPGKLELSWGNTVSIHGGGPSFTPFSHFRGPATGARGAVLQVAGKNAGTSDILWKSDLFPFVNDRIRVTSVDVALDSFARVVPGEGNEREFEVAISPNPLPSGVSLSVSVDRMFGAAGTASLLLPANGTLSQSGSIRIRGNEQSWGTGDVPAPANMALHIRLPDHAEDLVTAPFTVCAHPVNFRETSSHVAWMQRALHYEYAWDADSGYIYDLDKVWVGEKVTYSDGGIHRGEGRPWAKNNHDPTIRPNSADDLQGLYGMLQDNHYPPGPLPRAGPADSYTATQHYGFRCLRCGAGMTGPAANQSLESLLGPISIFRQVYRGINGWMYRIEKGDLNYECQLQ